MDLFSNTHDGEGVIDSKAFVKAFLETNRSEVIAYMKQLLDALIKSKEIQTSFQNFLTTLLNSDFVKLKVLDITKVNGIIEQFIATFEERMKEKLTKFLTDQKTQDELIVQLTADENVTRRILGKIFGSVDVQKTLAAMEARVTVLESKCI